MKKVVVSALVINSQSRILMTRRAGSRLYCPPGGKVEDGELLEAALRRELKEETGILVSERSMEYLGYVDLPDKVIFFFTIFTWAGQVENTEPEKHVDWEWLQDCPADSQCVAGLRAFNKYLRHEMHDRIAAKRGAA